MKISGKPHIGAAFPATHLSKAQSSLPDSDLQHITSTRKPTRKHRTPGISRVKSTKAPSGKRSRPETPLLKWKTKDDRQSVKEENEVEKDDDGQRRGRRGKGREASVSARKLAAGLWRLQFPEAVAGGCRRGGQLGFEMVGQQYKVPFQCHCNGKVNGSEANDYLQSASSTLRNWCLSKLQPSFQFSNSTMEGATKWDPVCLKTSDEAPQIFSEMKLLDQQVSAVSMVSALEAELEQARAHIQELETEHRSSKKKLEQFLKKFSEEKASWRSLQEKIQAFIDDMKVDLHRERKNRKRIEIMNSKLANELADAKLLAKRFMQDYEKERKARELIEEVCDELAKEIGEDKAEVEELKRDSTNIREEVDEERKMLQMAEVWREERVQMKLVDAKVALEERYSQMNKLVADLENFLRTMSVTPDVKEMKEAELLRNAARAVNVQDIKEFSYEPSNSDDIFSVLEEVHFGKPTEKDIEPCVPYSPASHASRIHTVSPEVTGINKNYVQRPANALCDQNGDIEEYESGWETVSQIEDQGSCYSPEGSTPSVKNNRCESNVLSRINWEENAVEETPITQISEICSIPAKNSKKVSSIARLWRSHPNNEKKYEIISIDGINGRISNGRISNAGIMSPDHGSSTSELVGQWRSPDSGHAHIRGMKGCIPCSAQKNSLKSKLMEARFESQKVQIRHVLKQKI